MLPGLPHNVAACSGERHAAFREATSVPRAAVAAAPAAARMADGDLLAAFLQLPEPRQQVWRLRNGACGILVMCRMHCAWEKPVQTLVACRV